MGEYIPQDITSTVLIIDDELRTDLYRIWLDEVSTVKTASSHVEGLAQIDETVSVVVLRHELAAEVKADVEARVKAVSPTARIAITTSSQDEVILPSIDNATIIREPITKEMLRDTVERLVHRAFYHEGLRQYYRLTMQATNREIQQTTKKVVPTDDVNGLRERIDELKKFLDYLGPRLKSEGKKEILDSLRPAPDFPRPSESPTQETGKYVPDECRDCGLEWGNDYGGAIGRGYIRVGAFTWRCTECQTIQHVRNPSNRAVAKRDY